MKVPEFVNIENVGSVVVALFFWATASFLTRLIASSVERTGFSDLLTSAVSAEIQGGIPTAMKIALWSSTTVVLLAIVLSGIST